MTNNNGLVYFHCDGGLCIAAPLPGGEGLTLKMRTCTIYCSKGTNFKVSYVQNKIGNHRFLIERLNNIVASIDVIDDAEANQLMKLMGIDELTTI